jgi:hypothetical protein
MRGACSMHGRDEKFFQICLKSVGKRSLTTRGSFDLKEIGWKYVGWVYLTQDVAQWQGCEDKKVKLSLCLTN